MTSTPQPQLGRARLVLSDACIAADRLKAAVDGGDYRIEWVATVALLRAVGHVLRKVDGRQPAARAAIDARWKVWQGDRETHEVFWEFIEKERNLVLKEYEIGSTAPQYLLTEDGHRLSLEDGSGFLLLETPDIERIDDATAWWARELTAIESAIT
jgi:hypothetical protein